MMPLATSSPRVMPPKMLMKIDFTRGSLLMTSRAPAMTSALAPPPMSRKLAGLAADLVDDVERAHGQPGAVGDDADEPSRPTYCRPFSWAACSRSSRTWVSS